MNSQTVIHVFLFGMVEFLTVKQNIEKSKAVIEVGRMLDGGTEIAEEIERLYSETYGNE